MVQWDGCHDCINQILLLTTKAHWTHPSVKVHLALATKGMVFVIWSIVYITVYLKPASTRVDHFIWMLCSIMPPAVRNAGTAHNPAERHMTKIVVWGILGGIVQSAAWVTVVAAQLSCDHKIEAPYNWHHHWSTFTMRTNKNKGQAAYWDGNHLANSIRFGRQPREIHAQEHSWEV
jgi:hypothetical protein